MYLLVSLFVMFLMSLGLCFWVNVVAHDIKCSLESAKEELKFHIEYGFKRSSNSNLGGSGTILLKDKT
jgi:hypothetical protein